MTNFEWTMKNGDSISVRNMSKSHIINAAKHCATKAKLSLEKRNYESFTHSLLWLLNFAEALKVYHSDNSLFETVKQQHKLLMDYYKFCDVGDDDRGAILEDSQSIF